MHILCMHSHHIATARSLWPHVDLACRYLPLTYKVNTAVVRKGIEGFEFGKQEFDIPVRQLRLPGQAAAVDTQGTAASGLNTGAIIGIVVAVVVASVAVAVAAFLVVREKRGKPVFAPLLPEGTTSVDV